MPVENAPWKRLLAVVVGI